MKAKIKELVKSFLKFIVPERFRPFVRKIGTPIYHFLFRIKPIKINPTPAIEVKPVAAKPTRLFPKCNAKGFIRLDNGYYQSVANKVYVNFKLDYTPDKDIVVLFNIHLDDDIKLTAFAGDRVLMKQNLSMDKVSFHLVIPPNLFNAHNSIELMLSLEGVLVIKELFVDNKTYHLQLNSENLFYILKANNDIVKIKLHSFIEETILVKFEVANKHIDCLVDIYFDGKVITNWRGDDDVFTVILPKSAVKGDYLELILNCDNGSIDIVAITVNSVVYRKLCYDYNISEKSDLVHQKLVSDILSSGGVICA